MIKFKTIRFKNVLSYGNYWTEFDLSGENMTAVIGLNGAGKSSALLDALTFAKFGKPFRKINKGRLVNTINNKDMVVELEFTSGDNEYKIVRGLKPTIFEIHVNGEKLDQNAKVVDLQEYLEKTILGYSIKSSNQIVILGSATFLPFMQLSAADRRSVIEDLLDASSFGKMLEITKRMSSTIRSRISDRREAERILGATEKGKLELLAQARKHTQETLDLLKGQLEAAAARGIQLHKEMKGFEESLKVTEEAHGRYHDFAGRTVPAFNAERQFMEREVLASNSALKGLAATFHCDRCGQDFENDRTTRDLATTRVETAQKSLEDLNAAFSKAKALAEEDRPEYDKHVSIMNNISSLRGEVNAAKRVITECQTRLKEATGSQTDSKEEEIKADILTLRSDLEKAAKRIAKDQELLRHANASSDVLRDDGVKAKLIKTYVPIINQLVNSYLSKMDFDISFHLDEEFNETIKSRHRDTFQYESFSEGEKKRIDLALLFTWRDVARLKNSANTNLLIMDEIIDGSADGLVVESFLKIIGEMEGTSRIVITHDHDILPSFDTVMKATKERGFSYMREQE